MWRTSMVCFIPRKSLSMKVGSCHQNPNNPNNNLKRDKQERDVFAGEVEPPPVPQIIFVNKPDPDRGQRRVAWQGAVAVLGHG